MPIGRRTILKAAALLTPLPFGQAVAGVTPSPKDAYLYIIWPVDGQRIRSPFWCRFGLRNMGITRAGDAAPNLGHHHLLIDVDDALDTAVAIPSDKKHRHFGSGQTESQIELPSGPHTLQLVLGDAEHMPFNPPVISRKVRIVVG